MPELASLTRAPVRGRRRADPTRKIRRGYVLDNYASDIEALYA
jgi:hypothetical protein